MLSILKDYKRLAAIVACVIKKVYLSVDKEPRPMLEPAKVQERPLLTKSKPLKVNERSVLVWQEKNQPLLVKRELKERIPKVLLIFTQLSITLSSLLLTN